MTRIFLTTVLCLTLASAIEAAPRDRRARRRAARTPAASVRPVTTAQPSRTYYSNNSGPTQMNVRPNNPTTYSTPSAYSQPKATYSQPSVATYMPTVQSTTTATPQPMILSMANDSGWNNSVLSDETASVVSPINSSFDSTTGGVVQASAVQPVPDALPSVDSNQSLTEPEPCCASCSVIPAGQSFNSALAELNSIRAQKGLPALIEDPALSAIAHQKASIQASRGVMYHPGGTMGGARFEGVGMGARFTSCYQDATNVRYAGAATVTGRNGQRFHCLLVK